MQSSEWSNRNKKRETFFLLQTLSHLVPSTWNKSRRNDWMTEWGMREWDEKERRVWGVKTESEVLLRREKEKIEMWKLKSKKKL